MQVLDLSKFPSSNQTIYKTRIDKIEAKFHYSSNNESIEKIEITSSTIPITGSTKPKKIHDVTYCDITDAIEIHFYRNEQSSFQSKTYTLLNCKLNALRVLVLEYPQGETPEVCASSKTSNTTPDKKKGSVIVGNP